MHQINSLGVWADEDPIWAAIERTKDLHVGLGDIEVDDESWMYVWYYGKAVGYDGLTPSDCEWMVPGTFERRETQC